MSHEAWIAGLRWEDLPEPVQHQARRCLKDIVATAAGALALPAAGPIERLVAAQFGAGPAPMLFRGPMTTLAGAAFGNALRIDGLDCHDGFRLNKGHAGATVVPVLLAAATLRTVSGAELLAALVAGYEIALRAGLALHATYAPAYHGSGAWAALGAAAAGAHLLGIPADELDAVLGAAEYHGPMAPILRCTVHPSIVKDGAGAGALSAGMALAMHAQGLSGLPSLFTYEPKGRKQVSSLGKDWLILKQYFKLYPTCRWTHAPVEGVARLRAQHGFTAADVERVEVESFAETATLMTFPPKDSDGAQYCLPWAVAAMLVDGELGVDQVLPGRLGDSAIVEMGRRVVFRQADDLQARFPAECLARVRVFLKNGRTLAGPTLGARGDYTDPASDGELDAKFSRLAARTLGAGPARALGEVLDTLNRRPAADLLSLLTPGGRA
ncbi:MAG: MmgE/PrpD family protein [Spirochaetes bacterium]|nr:MmgE/PrpD family protein [Spirochaetota bacterium]